MNPRDQDHIAAEEAANVMACHECAQANGHTTDRADECEVGSLNCRGCPLAAPSQPVTPSYHRDIWGISHAIARINEADYIAAFMLDHEPEPDGYAGVIAWLGDKQCKLLVTESAIKHEHTPGAAMRNAAHTCVQGLLAALLEKEGGAL